MECGRVIYCLYWRQTRTNLKGTLAVRCRVSPYQRSDSKSTIEVVRNPSSKLALEPRMQSAHSMTARECATGMVLLPSLNKPTGAPDRCCSGVRNAGASHFPDVCPNWTLAMPSAQKLDTRHKALTPNLDAPASVLSPKSALDRRSRVGSFSWEGLRHGG